MQEGRCEGNHSTIFSKTTRDFYLSQQTRTEVGLCLISHYCHLCEFQNSEISQQFSWIRKLTKLTTELVNNDICEQTLRITNTKDFVIVLLRNFGCGKVYHSTSVTCSYSYSQKMENQSLKSKEPSSFFAFCLDILALTLEFLPTFLLFQFFTVTMVC